MGLQFPTAAEDASESSATRDFRIAHVLADEGLKKLSQARYEEASRIFNAGLKFSPDDAQLHFLTGLSYHLLYLRGDEAMKELAVTGYELALNHDAAHYYAAIQLGRLQFDARRYGLSAEAFRHAIDIQPQNGAAHLGLASAAYYAHDLLPARAAAEKAVSLLPGSAEAARALAMIHAALGNEAMARDASARYAVLEQNPGTRARLDARLDEWRAWHRTVSSPQGEAVPGSKDVLTAQAPSRHSGNEELVLPGSRPGSPSSSDDAPRRDDAPGIAVPGETQADRAARRPWFDCGEPESDRGQYLGGGNYAPNTAEVAPMPRLPSPCPGAANPRMAILDIAFIRTDNDASSSHGINLLEGLTVVFGLSRTTVDTLTQSSLNPDVRVIDLGASDR
jgi:Flp pilus assembly protein TadD